MNSSLPKRNGLPINLLSACFNNTVATYKFYWFLSILQNVEQGLFRISKQRIFAQMISNAWYTVNYFHVSFGKFDNIQKAILNVIEIENIAVDENRDGIVSKLVDSGNASTRRELKQFNNNVPHWFLSPWFPKMTRSEIYDSSKSFDNDCIYGLYDDYIEVNPIWVDYLNSNVRVLKDFCYWNLSLFLQGKNPNVPDIPNKLIKPATRNSLVRQRKDFWDVVLNELGYVDCIYTGKRLSVGGYDVEHFVPYSFVSHDLIWNLLPADVSYNRVKSDKLPNMGRFFEPFFGIQNVAKDIVKNKNPKNRFLEDYLTIFPDIEGSFTSERFKEHLQPLITIAANNGYEYL